MPSMTIVVSIVAADSAARILRFDDGELAFTWAASYHLSSSSRITVLRRSHWLLPDHADDVELLVLACGAKLSTASRTSLKTSNNLLSCVISSSSSVRLLGFTSFNAPPNLVNEV